MSEQVMIHVRFAPDGTVNEISERPSGVSAQVWFDHLSRDVSNNFQALSGGRGLFRVTREQCDATRAAVAAGAGA